MSIIATCSCGMSFRAKPELAGKRVQCPTCGAPLQIPPQAAPAPAANDPLGIGPMDETAFNAPPPSSPGSVTLSTPSSYAAPTRRSGSGSNRGLYIALGIGGGVVALVGLVVVLLALLLPAIRGARDAARKAQARSAKEPAAPGGEAVSEANGDSIPGWDTYTSAAGGYSVFMPRSPTVRTQVMPSPAGALRVVMVIAEQGSEGAFFASHCVLPRVDADPNQILEDGVQGMMRTYNATISSNRSFTIEGSAAKEVDFNGNHLGKRLTGRVRVLLADKTLYQLFWLGPPGQKPEREIRRFFDSFKLSQRPAAPSGSPVPANPSTKPPPTPTPPTSPAPAHREPLSEWTESRKQRVYATLMMEEKTFQASEEQAKTLESMGQSEQAAKIRAAAAQGRALLAKHRESQEENLMRAYQLTREELTELKREGQQKGW